MDKFKQLKLLRLLVESDDYLTSTQLSDKLLLSSKTVQRYIKILNESLKKYNVEIISTRGMGFKLEGGKDKLYYILDDYSEDFSVKRVNTIILKIISNEIITIEKLSEEMMYSSSTLNKLMKNIKYLLAEYSLELKSRPYYGLKVTGKEEDIRKLLMDIAFGIGTNFNIQCFLPTISQSTFETIKDLVIHSLQNNKLKILDEDALSFLMNVTIVIFRSSVKANIEVKFSTKSTFISSLLLDIGKQLKINIPQSEIKFLSKKFQNIFEQANQPQLSADPSIIYFVTSICKEIESIYTDVILDEKLIDSLALHLHLFSKRDSSNNRKNPLLKNISSEYEKELLYAKTYIELVNKKTQQYIPETELGYIVIYFILSRYQIKHKKKKIVILCNYGFAISRFIETNIYNDINNVEILGTYPLYCLNIINDLDFDVIVSTIPLEGFDNRIVIIRDLFNDDFTTKIKQLIN